MRLYRAAGTYYEKQADVPKGARFEAVEVPFAASPKADFVAWMNERERDKQPGDDAPLFGHANPEIEPLGKPQPAPAQPSPAHAAQVLAFEDEWANFPLGRKLHFAALACEDAREAIKP